MLDSECPDSATILGYPVLYVFCLEMTETAVAAMLSVVLLCWLLMTLSHFYIKDHINSIQCFSPYSFWFMEVFQFSC